MFAKQWGVNLSHDFFSHLTDERKQELYNRLNINASHIFAFYNADNIDIPIYAAVIDINDDRIHVSEVGGSFAFKMLYCERLCKMLAGYYKREIISFCTVKPIVEKIGKRMNFTPSEKYKNEFEKRVA